MHNKDDSTSATNEVEAALAALKPQSRFTVPAALRHHSLYLDVWMADQEELAEQVDRLALRREPLW